MTADGNTINISGGSFERSAVGIGHVQVHAPGDVASAVDELRSRLTSGVEEIIALGRTDDERAEIRHELRKIGKELDAPEPDGSAVRTRWSSVLSVLDGVLATGNKLAAITDLVRQAFGG